MQNQLDFMKVTTMFEMKASCLIFDKRRFSINIF